MGSVAYCRPDGVVHRTSPLGSCSAFHRGSCLTRWSKRHLGFPLHRQVRPPASYGMLCSKSQFAAGRARGARFSPTRRRPGYVQQDVDDLLREIDLYAEPRRSALGRRGKRAYPPL